jgi:hypothetical protein
MERHRLGLVLAVSILSTGCKALTGESDDALTVVSERESLRLRNGSMGRVHYMVVEQGTAALINWAPCTGDGCPAVRARSSVLVPYDEILGYSPEARNAIVYWWPSTSLERLQGDRDLIEWVVVPF